MVKKKKKKWEGGGGGGQNQTENYYRVHKNITCTLNLNLTMVFLHQFHIHMFMFILWDTKEKHCKMNYNFGFTVQDSLSVHSSVSRSSKSMTVDSALRLVAARHIVIRHKVAYIHNSKPYNVKRETCLYAKSSCHGLWQISSVLYPENWQCTATAANTRLWHHCTSLHEIMTLLCNLKSQVGRKKKHQPKMEVAK